jgi:hypothetical protein
LHWNAGLLKRLAIPALDDDDEDEVRDEDEGGLSVRTEYRSGGEWALAKAAARLADSDCADEDADKEDGDAYDDDDADENVRDGAEEE